MADESQPDQAPGRQPASGAPGAESSRDDAPTEWIESSQPPRDDPYAAGGGGVPPAGTDTGSGGGRRRWIVPIAAIAAVALIGGGAFAAYTVLSGGGSQPAVAVPSSALAYARIDLDPSADQKVNMLRLLRNVPEFEEETGITSDTDDLRERLFEKALEEEEGCSDLRYDDDIKPWIGERAGFAALAADEGTEPDALVVLQVSDEDAARDGIDALIQCAQDEGDSDDEMGVAFVDDYALLAETQDLADQFAEDAEEESLADSAAFTADIDALDGEGLASFWVDVDAAIEFAEESDPEMAASLDASGFDDWGSAAMALRAQSDAIELVSVYNGDVPLLGPDDGGSEPVHDVQQLPDSSLMALGFTGGGDAVMELWDELGTLADAQAGTGGGLEAYADQIQAQFGIDLPEDVAVLLGDEFTLGLDSSGFESIASTGEPDPSAINLGARMRTDADAVRDLVTRVQDLVSVQLGLSFDIAEADLDDDGIVLASNDSYAQMLSEDGSLGESDAFQSAVADPDSASSVFFLDFDKMSEVADTLEQGGEAVPDDVSAWVDAVRAFGFSATDDGDYTRSTSRLVFD